MTVCVPLVNICETCDNFVPGPEHLPILRDQLDDVRKLRDDAASRGWDSEQARHDMVMGALESHCRRLQS